jgi:hypothetical protein
VVLAALLVVGAALLAWAVLSHGRHFDAFGREEGLTNVGPGPGPGGTASSSPGVGPSGTATAGGPGGAGAGSGGGSGSNDGSGSGSGSGSGTGSGSGSGSGSGGSGSGGSSPGSGGGSGGGGSGGGGSTGPIGAGDYAVGTDIVVGAWTTAGPLLTLNVCSYSVNGHPAIQITASVVATTIHLSAGDTFVTQGCQDWRHTG